VKEAKLQQLKKSQQSDGYEHVMTSDRIPSRPKPASFRPIYMEPQKSQQNKNADAIGADEAEIAWWQTRYFKLLMILSSMLGFVVSSACLFATLLIDPKLTTNFDGEVGVFFQNMYAHYGTAGVLTFWGISLIYFFVMAYRNAVKF
jgi:hypothetical protein